MLQIQTAASMGGEKNALVEAMQNMFENVTSTDVTIEIEGGETIKAHKFVLVSIEIYKSTSTCAIVSDVVVSHFQQSRPIL